MASQKLAACDSVWANCRLATFDPKIKLPYGLLKNHLLGIKKGIIEALLPQDEVDLSRFKGKIIDGKNGLLTPGFIDCHTHLIYGGHRAGDFEKRLCGQTYEEIARAGGGILSTVQATRTLSEEELALQAAPRLEALIKDGVTTVEIKSGYGLTVDDELKMLRAAKRLEKNHAIRVRTTLLAAHAIPPEYRDKPDDYVELVCREIIPRAKAEGLADNVDLFCEKIAFNLKQAESIFQAAKNNGLGIKVHAEQLSLSGGAQLAARFGALSADHLEYLDEAGAAALKASGTIAVLLPGAFYFLKETRKPPVDLLKKHGVPIALATDLNPGSSPLASLRLMLNMGCTFFGLTPEEALAGITRNAAQALGLGERLGTLTIGKETDFLLWDIDDPAQLAGEFGWGTPRQRVLRGKDAHA